MKYTSGTGANELINADLTALIWAYLNLVSYL